MMTDTVMTIVLRLELDSWQDIIEGFDQILLDDKRSRGHNRYYTT